MIPLNLLIDNSQRRGLNDLNCKWSKDCILQVFLAKVLFAFLMHIDKIFDEHTNSWTQ